MTKAPRPDPVRAAWEANAEFWDSRMADGNRTQSELVGPTTDRLLGAVQGRRVLDLACGNGVSARRLARMGADVVAVDFSRALVARARARGVPRAGKIRYVVADLTRPATLDAAVDGPVDAAVCNMALMDVRELRPLGRWLAGRLRPGSPFVVSVCHPAFNGGDVERVVTERDDDGVLRDELAVQVRRYLTPRRHRGLAMVGQPVPHLYFDRPISGLLRPFLDAGFVLDAFEEPAFARAGASDRPLSWSRFAEIPPILVVRLRAPPAGGRGVSPTLRGAARSRPSRAR